MCHQKQDQASERLHRDSAIRDGSYGGQDRRDWKPCSVVEEGSSSMGHGGFFQLVKQTSWLSRDDADWSLGASFWNASGMIAWTAKGRDN